MYNLVCDKGTKNSGGDYYSLYMHEIFWSYQQIYDNDFEFTLFDFSHCTLTLAVGLAFFFFFVMVRKFHPQNVVLVAS